jgi:hypothetical protein
MHGRQRLSKPLFGVRNGSDDPVLTLCSTHEGGNMRKQLITLVGVLSLVVVAGSAFAQTVYVRGKIPFDFIVGKTTLPSGAYEIRSLNDGPDKTLLLRGPDSHSNVMVGANRVESFKGSDATKLVFDRVGDQYFLREIWTEGAKSGRQFPKGKLESELAMNNSPENVVVLADLK